MTDYDSKTGVVTLSEPTTEIYTVALWANAKLNLQWNDYEWTYTKTRVLNLQNALSATLKGTVQGITNPQHLHIVLLLNDQELETFQDTSVINSVNIDVWAGLYDGANDFSVKLTKFNPVEGRFAFCDARVTLYLEIEYPIGETPPPPKPPTECFIATVAFGSALAPELDHIRAFRDRCLPDLFVRSYYRWGKWLSRFIARRKALKAWVRACLWLVFVRKR